MGPIYVDTMADWVGVKSAIVPVYVTSKTRGRVLVPCTNTVLIRAELVVKNCYNPNHVSPDKMSLLMKSIVEYGFCYPVVAVWDDERSLFVIVDGFHRRIISGDEWLDFDYVPCVVLDLTMAQRLAATKVFNDARGKHQVDLDAELVRLLMEQGLSDEDVAEKLGMELDTVHRYKTLTGVAAIFANVSYSPSWSILEVDESVPES